MVFSQTSFLDDGLLSSHNPSTWQCIDILMRNYLAVTPGSKRVKRLFDMILHFWWLLNVKVTKLAAWRRLLNQSFVSFWWCIKRSIKTDLNKAITEICRGEQIFWKERIRKANGEDWQSVDDNLDKNRQIFLSAQISIMLLWSLQI